MIDAFHKWGTFGYRWSETSGVWTEIVSDVGDGCFSAIISEDSSNSVAVSEVPQGRYGRIRGESLRCLYVILREHRDALSGQQRSYFGDSGTRPGLATIVIRDSNVYARRFAMYAMIVPLRSQKVRKWIGQFKAPDKVERRSGSSLSEDVHASLELLIGGLQALLERSREGDVSTACHVLSDFAGGIPWKSFNNMASVIFGIIRQLGDHLLNCASVSLSEKLVSGLAYLVPQVELSVEDRSCLLNTLMDKIPAEDTIHARLYILSGNLLVNRLANSSFSAGSLIVAGLRLVEAIITDTVIKIDTTPHVERCMIATLRNLSQLEGDRMDVLESCLRINQSPELRDDARDALLVGVGKLSRISYQALTWAINQNVGLHEKASHASIECVGDLAFSAILHGIDSVTYLDKLFVWLEHEGTRERSLRAIMTGISRLRETRYQIRSSSAQQTLILRLSTILQAIWALSNCPVNLRADSIRTFGLLQPLISYSNNVHGSLAENATEALLEALNSSKTQLTLAAFYSITEMKLAEREVDFAIPHIVKTIDNIWEQLEKHTEWDFASVPFLTGKLHALCEGYRCIDRCGQSMLLEDNRRLTVMQNTRLKSLSKFNSHIAKYMDLLHERLQNSESIHL
jgi:hypothetical protein